MYMGNEKINKCELITDYTDIIIIDFTPHHC